MYLSNASNNFSLFFRFYSSKVGTRKLLVANKEKLPNDIDATAFLQSINGTSFSQGKLYVVQLYATTFHHLLCDNIFPVMTNNVRN